MKKYFFFVFAFTTIFSSCSKDDDNTDRDSSGDKIYPVHIKLSAEEMAKNRYATFEKTDSTKVGKGGVRLCNDPVSYGVVFAFDLACPIEWNDNEINRVVSGPSGTLYYVCEKCESVFDRITGVATGGLAKEKNKNLKRYQVVKQSDGSWLISN